MPTLFTASVFLQDLGSLDFVVLQRLIGYIDCRDWKNVCEVWPALDYYCQRTFLVLEDFDEASIPTDGPLPVREIRSREKYLPAPLPDGSAGLLIRMINSNRLCCRFLTVLDIGSEGQTVPHYLSFRIRRRE